MRIDFMGVSRAAKMVDRANRFIKAALVEAGIDDIEPCHGDVLGALFVCDGRRIGELARETHRTKPTLTVLVDKLEARGYVRRVPSKTDARAIEVRLTPKCRRLAPIFKDVSARMVAEITRNLTADERTTLDALLAKTLEPSDSFEHHEPPNSKEQTT